ncbi:MAG: hypothetical protein LBT92_03725 [Rickettsiales bacterium]|jgi:4'-phosphopantetheinyl transferase|nr:hypothetical protein [Rickettsiales bacterium]
MQVFTADIEKLDMARCLALLDDAEKARAASMASEKRRTEFIAGHGFVKEKLGTILGTDPKEAKIGPDGFMGKNTSISHSGGRVAAAISDMPVGIDIERMQDRDIARISARLKFENCRTADEFYRLWTMREAEYKLRSSHPSGRRAVFEASEDGEYAMATAEYET